MDELLQLFTQLRQKENASASIAGDRIMKIIEDEQSINWLLQIGEQSIDQYFLFQSLIGIRNYLTIHSIGNADLLVHIFTQMLHFLDVRPDENLFKLCSTPFELVIKQIKDGNNAAQLVFQQVFPFCQTHLRIGTDLLTLFLGVLPTAYTGQIISAISTVLDAGFSCGDFSIIPSTIKLFYTVFMLHFGNPTFDSSAYTSKYFPNLLQILKNSLQTNNNEIVHSIYSEFNIFLDLGILTSREFLELIPLLTQALQSGYNVKVKSTLLISLGYIATLLMIETQTAANVYSFALNLHIILQSADDLERDIFIYSYNIFLCLLFPLFKLSELSEIVHKTIGEAFGQQNTPLSQKMAALTVIEVSFAHFSSIFMNEDLSGLFNYLLDLGFSDELTISDHAQSILRTGADSLFNKLICSRAEELVSTMLGHALNNGRNCFSLIAKFVGVMPPGLPFEQQVLMQLVSLCGGIPSEMYNGYFLLIRVLITKTDLSPFFEPFWNFVCSLISSDIEDFQQEALLIIGVMSKNKVSMVMFNPQILEVIFGQISNALGNDDVSLKMAGYRSLTQVFQAYGDKIIQAVAPFYDDARAIVESDDLNPMVLEALKPCVLNFLAELVVYLPPEIADQLIDLAIINIASYIEPLINPALSLIRRAVTMPAIKENAEKMKATLVVLLDVIQIKPPSPISYLTTMTKIISNSRQIDLEFANQIFKIMFEFITSLQNQATGEFRINSRLSEAISEVIGSTICYSPAETYPFLSKHLEVMVASPEDHEFFNFMMDLIGALVEVMPFDHEMAAHLIEFGMNNMNENAASTIGSIIRKYPDLANPELVNPLIGMVNQNNEDEGLNELIIGILTSIDRTQNVFASPELYKWLLAHLPFEFHPEMNGLAWMSVFRYFDNLLAVDGAMVVEYAKLLTKSFHCNPEELQQIILPPMAWSQIARTAGITFAVLKDRMDIFQQFLGNSPELMSNFLTNITTIQQHYKKE